MPISFGFGKGQLLPKGQGSPPLILDTYGSDVLGAYSLRLLKSSYSGSIIRVRRSSDNTLQNFTATEITDGTLATWVGAGNDGFVHTWYDQSGNNNNATQTSTSLQPKIVSAGALITESSKPAVRFSDDGTNKLQLTTRLTNVRTSVSVQKLAANATASQFNFLFGDIAAGGWTSYHPAEWTGPWISPSWAQADVRNGANKINGASAVLTSTGMNTNRFLLSITPTGDTVIAQFANDRSWATRGWRGTIQEIIIYSANKSSIVSAIETQINTYYSIY